MLEKKKLLIKDIKGEKDIFTIYFNAKKYGSV